MRARAALRFGWLVFAAGLALAPAAAIAATPHVEQADLNGDINNVMSAYIQNAVSRAESDNASALLVVMNTPGGISTSMDEIVTSLLNCNSSSPRPPTSWPWLPGPTSVRRTRSRPPART